MKKRYLKTVEDVLALKDTDTKIYSECEEGGYYQFVDGVLCAFDNNDDGWTIYPTLNDQEELYILEEEPMQKVTKEDLGKLCWFFDGDTDKRIIGVLSAISTFGYHKICKYQNLSWKHCRKLSPSEVAEITGYKVEKAE